MALKPEVLATIIIADTWKTADEAGLWELYRFLQTPDWLKLVRTLEGVYTGKEEPYAQDSRLGRYNAKDGHPYVEFEPLRELLLNQLALELVKTSVFKRSMMDASLESIPNSD
jgi:predicted phosphoadenosine phosphosulfate sulfurtransferase